MELSVVIPTYNRRETLAQALGALFAQRGLEQTAWEIIVVDDGSTDGTDSLVTELAAKSPCPLTCLYQQNSGPGAARNTGIRKATAPLVLMIGDDILAQPGLLAEHLSAHARYPALQVAVLGPVDWAPTLTVTPFMRWWSENRFRFEMLRAGKVEPDFWFFYTCNISVKRRFLLEYGLFDETFRAAAYEDTELAYRLSQAGLRIHFARQADAYHNHPVDLQAACQRMEKIGRWSLTFEAKTHHFWSAPPSWIRLSKAPWLHPRIASPLRTWADWWQTRAVVDPLYTIVMMHHFWVGRRQAASGGQL
jgi:glycosyltransferase involved in cell wall biosynthesis